MTSTPAHAYRTRAHPVRAVKVRFTAQERAAIDAARETVAERTGRKPSVSSLIAKIVAGALIL